MGLSSHRDETDRTEETSEEDEDDEAFDEDMEALRRACMLTGTNPDEIKDATGTNITSPTTSGSVGRSDDEDDLELVRNIQQRFSIPSDANQPLILKPLSSLPPVVSDDEEDDFETLRAIERRFSKYDSYALKKNADNDLNKSESVCGTGISLEQGTPSVLFAERNNAEVLGEELSNSGKTCNVDQPSNFIEWHQSKATRSSTLPLKYSGFPNPEAAEVFINAIKKNRSCQKFIRSKLIQIEARIEENKRLKERVKVLKDFQVACRKRAGRALSQRKDARVQLISVRKSKNSPTMKVNHKKAPALSFGPVENSHVANYRIVLKRFPLSLSRQRWSETDKENLWKGIKQQFQEMLLQKSVEVCGYVLYGDVTFENNVPGAYFLPNTCFRDSASGDSNILDDIIASITNFEITPVNIRYFLPKVDWERLASTYVVGRSGAECEQRWLNIEDPLINHNPWTKPEDKKLLFILQQGGIYNWINISITLGTNRTPFQCLARYQRSLNSNIMKRDWTKDDDTQLRAAVEAFGENDWQLIAFNLEGRTGTQCSNRWIKTLHPARKRVGRWTVEEDKRLKVAVMLFGPKTWQKIAQFVPGRTQVQCRERWVNCLDPSLNLEEWTEEEDCKLKAAIAEYGHCWSKVAASVPPRTDSQCRRRWKVLLPHEVPLVQAARKIQKAALISNFVDREAERPALDPTDFLSLPGTNSISEPENGKNIGKEKKSRGKPKSKKTKDVTSCDAAPKNISSERSRTEGETCHERNSRIQHVEDVETCGEEGTVLKEKKRAPNKRFKMNQCTKPAPCDQDIPFLPEDSNILRITDVDNIENSAEDGTVSRKRKRAPKSCLKKNQCTNPTPGNQDIPPFPDDSSILRITSGDDNTENCGDDGTILVKKKRAPNRRVKRNQCTNPVPGNQDIPLFPEDSTILRITNGDDNIENCDEDGTVMGKKKRAPNKRLRRNQCTHPDPGNQEVPLLLEDSTILKKTEGDDNIENCGEDATVSGKKKRAPKRRLKTNQGANTFSGNQDTPLLPEDSTILRITNGDEHIETCGEVYTGSRKRKMAPNKRLKGNQHTEQAAGNQDILLCPEDSTIRITDVNDNIESFGEEGNISSMKNNNKKKRPKSHSKRNTSTDQPVQDQEDLSLPPDDSASLQVTNCENIQTIGGVDAHSRDQDVQDQQDLSLPPDNSTSLQVTNSDDIQTIGGVGARSSDQGPS
ncbi:SANT/Myb domain [Macleaya cordata]|uniref:SANT/Myb domain n=1 Tax=Macleaya cordata TaxID=56857 RepID=A0A200PR03_MACCD|nr:SANT/Myb domain [Macleaya cordata]